MAMRRALGGRPAMRRSTNFYSAAFQRHRNCNVRSIDFAGDTVTCTECGNKWLLKRDSRGEPVGYTILPRVLVEGLVG